MADFNTKSIRNIVLLGHGGSGKTSIAEAALYLAKVMDMNLSKLQKIMEDGGAWPATVHGLQRVQYDFATEQQN